MSFIIIIIILLLGVLNKWTNGPEGACWGSEGDLITEQRGLCVAFNPACTPFSAFRLLYLCLHTQLSEYLMRPIYKIIHHNKTSILVKKK